ncbi:MAG: hypothetical protein OCU18_08505 [Candidatus Syntrophoarchaeum sp.]|nr:hypothetical protein [Candidatus Syntrophoarchaeum sp.]
MLKTIDLDMESSITFEIDDKEKKKFHGICINNNESMSDVLRKCVKNYINAHKPRFVSIS